MTCPVCGTENPEIARFCLACGAALTAEPAREERKVVTVLFADLVGFTSRAEQLDPEDVRAVLAPYWDRLRTELERRGGTVEKFIGDAVMALFGAPVAHEDDPLRAVGAALAIRDWARDEADVQVRIAVNTGEALVLLGARPAEGEGMAAGDVVNTAARLQSAAPVNGVLVGETTYRATRDVIEYREHEAVAAKGKAEPLPVWEAVQLRSRLGTDVERATLPLVGRTRELGVILDAFERARAEHEPQLVTLVGVPGIGKSRLVGEFFSRLEQDPELTWWRQGRALPYGEGVSFWALAEMVKAQAGVDENDDAATAAAKLAASVDAYVDEDERGWVLDHLLPLVGGAGARGGESAPAWRRYFEGLAEARPLVAVFEDMHWADDGLLDFIDHLVDWASGVPMLVIATARPELLDRRPSWGGGKLNVSTIALTPLSDGESAQIIHGVLERSALPVETQQALVERAGGNPLYAEQFARLYVERGTADDLPLPETVQGLIAARLDGLAPEEKRVMQDASVFGKVFWAGAIAAAPETLHSLERKGMLRRERRSAVAGETEYAFRHVLVRDVAYGQIPRAARGAKHVRAADWIESLGRAEDHAELVAHHLAEALDLGHGDPKRAAAALRRAGERALALGAFPSAEHLYARALALWTEPDASRARLQAAHARAAYYVRDDLALVEPALDALEAAGLAEEAAAFAAFATNGAWRAGRPTAPLLDRAAGLLEGRPASPALAELLTERGRVRWFDGDYDAAVADLEAAGELAARFDLAELAASVTVTQGVIALTDGELDLARRRFEQVVASMPLGSPARLRALTNLSVTAAMEGDMEEVARRHPAAEQEATRLGDRSTLRWLEYEKVGMAFDQGRWEEGIARSSRLLERGAGYQDLTIAPVHGIMLAARGDERGGRAALEHVLAHLELPTDTQTAVPARMYSAALALLLGDRATASSLVAAAAPYVRASRHRAPGVIAVATLAAVATGHAEEWLAFSNRSAPTRRVLAARLLLEGRLAEAADAWARVSPNDEAWVRLEAARRFAAEGRQVEAEVQLERALAFFRAVGATKVVADAERLPAPAAAAE